MLGPPVLGLPVLGPPVLGPPVLGRPVLGPPVLQLTVLLSNSPYPFFITLLVKSLPLYIPLAWKRHPFSTEYPCASVHV